jgi:hypothetical protein
MRTLYPGTWIWTFYKFADNDVAVCTIERQRHEICNPGHGSPTQSYQSLRSRGTGSNLPHAYLRADARESSRVKRNGPSVKGQAKSACRRSASTLIIDQFILPKQKCQQREAWRPRQHHSQEYCL